MTSIFEHRIRHIAVTGATGYIGERLCTLALAKGWRVTALSRKAPANVGISHIPFDLTDDTKELPMGVDAVVHLAADTTGETISATVELQAALRLMRQLGNVSRKPFVFVSSQSALNPVSAYGTSKATVEREVLQFGGIVIRPGLVYGGRTRKGAYAGLVARVSRLRLLPRFVPDCGVQLIHRDELCKGILTIVDHGISGPQMFCLAGQVTSFSAFLRDIARIRLNRSPLSVPVPTAMLASGLRAIAVLRPKHRASASSFSALLNSLPMDSRDSLEKLGLILRPVEDGLRPSGSGRRRRLASEAKVLLRYAGGYGPGPALVRRYIRVIERFAGGHPLRLGPHWGLFPSAICMLELRGFRAGFKISEALEPRLTLALRLAELTPRGAIAYLLLRRRPFPLAATHLIGIGILEMLVQAAKIVTRLGLGTAGLLGRPTNGRK